MEPTTAHRSAEVHSTRTMIDRVEDRLGLKPERLTGDTASGSAPMLECGVADKQIEPDVPAWDKPMAKRACSVDAILPGMNNQIVTIALAGKHCCHAVIDKILSFTGQIQKMLMQISNRFRISCYHYPTVN